MVDRLVAVDDADYRLPEPVLAALGTDMGDAGNPLGAQLSATFAREQIIDANKHGVKADGVTDDAAAWQAVVNTAGPGSVITWTGRSILKEAIHWRTGISLHGRGRGKSVLATVDTTGTKYFSAIQWVPYDGASAANPLTDCTFRDFEIDGSGLTGTAYNISAKGIFAQWLIRCQFLNLYIHDTIATGLGTDFMPECVIDGVLAERCGRNHAGDAGGGAGVGIGMGAWEEESVTITNCHALDNGNWGIFVEYQETEAFRGRGARIVNCTATGNRIGIGDRGTAGTIISGNVVHHNELDGINVSFGARDGIVSTNLTYQNARDGIGFNNDVRNPYTVTKNRAFDNALRGINVANTNLPFSGLTVTDNEVYRNGLHGIAIASSSGGSYTNPNISRNRVYDNGQTSISRGVLFDCTATGFTIDQNDIYDTQTTKTQTVGIKLADSELQTLTNGSIDGNKLADSPTPFSLGAAVRTNVSIARNTGYVTETSGTGTLAIGAAAADFTHGLASGLIPASVTLTPRGEAVTMYTNNRNGAIFRAARSGATTTALVFDWIARA